MLRFSTNNDTPKLKKIYNICFPGESEFCDRYFETVLPKNRCVVYDESGIQGMVHLIDVEAELDSTSYKGAYLYAVATLPEYRGKGIAASILEYIENYCRNEGYDFLCLIPQKPSLFDFYARFGLTSGLYTSKHTLSVFENTGGDINISSQPNYEGLQKVYEAHRCCKIKRTAETFISIEKVYDARFNCLLENGLVTAYCIGGFEDKLYEVYEAAGSKEDILKLVNAVAIKNNCEKAEITAPHDVFDPSVYGCTKPLTPRAEALLKTEKIYANLLFN